MSTEQPKPNLNDLPDDHVQSVEDTENEILDAAAQALAAERGDDSRVKELEEQLAAARDQSLRALAELDNTRKRAAKDREDAGAYSISKFARDLLSVADNLRRAIDAIPQELKLDDRVSSMITGVEATEKELLKIFSLNGIDKIEPVGEKFNANFHEVMFEAPVPGKDSGVIIQIIEPGYVLKGRLLRAAKVGIAKGGDVPPNGSTHFIDEQA